MVGSPRQPSSAWKPAGFPEMRPLHPSTLFSSSHFHPPLYPLKRPMNSIGPGQLEPQIFFFFFFIQQFTFAYSCIVSLHIFKCNTQKDTRDKKMIYNPTCYFHVSCYPLDHPAPIDENIISSFLNFDIIIFLVFFFFFLVAKQIIFTF